MVFNLRKVLMSFLLAFMLFPALTFAANTDFKGKETVNINKATAATFAAYLKGVGANKAEAIVKYRKKNGKFKNIESLNDVPGIGEATFKDIKRNISTSRGKSVAPEGYTMGGTSGKTVKRNKKKPSGTSSSSTRSSKTSSRSSTTSSASSRSTSTSASVKKAKKPKKPKKDKKKKKSKKKDK